MHIWEFYFTCEFRALSILWQSGREQLWAATTWKIKLSNTVVYELFL